jgi:septal ring factor EnvC (AmiA/AmiB activator)
MRRRIGLSISLSLAILVGGFLAPPALAVTQQDVEQARQHMRQLTAQLEGKVVEYEQAALEESDLRARLDRVRLDMTAREQELAAARTAARDRVAEMYMAAGMGNTAGFGGVGTLDETPARMAYLDSVAHTDREVVNRLETARRDYVRQNDLLEETLAQQAELASGLEALVGDIYSQLDAANAEYQAVKAEWDRQEAERLRELFLSTSTTTTLPRPATTIPGQTTVPGETTVPTSPGTTEPPPLPPPAGTMVCPVDGATTFRDSWGEPRPEGRSHSGVDMIASSGTPLVAIETGVISRASWHYAGGNGLYLQGDSGDRWYYAHLKGYASGISSGSRVVAGQLVGYVGATGNAAGPHLHLARILSDGQYVDPYPIVRDLCG